MENSTGQPPDVCESYNGVPMYVKFVELKPPPETPAEKLKLLVLRKFFISLEEEVKGIKRLGDGSLTVEVAATNQARTLLT